MFQTACRTMHIDLKGLCPQADFAHKLMDDLQSFGYNYILMEFEDKFPFECCPEIVHPGAYTKAELAKFERPGLSVIPLMQCAGHLDYLLAHEKYASYRDAGRTYQWNLALEETFELWRKMADEILEVYPNAEYFHIGADEVELADNTEFERYLMHVERCVDYLRDRGLKVLIWDDVFRRHDHEALNRLLAKVTVCVWQYRAIDENLVINMVKRGAEVWGASRIQTNTKYRGMGRLLLKYKNLNEWIEISQRHQLPGHIGTLWGRAQCLSPLNAALPESMYMAAYLAHGLVNGKVDRPEFDRKFAAEYFGTPEFEMGRFADMIANDPDMAAPLLIPTAKNNEIIEIWKLLNEIDSLFKYCDRCFAANQGMYAGYKKGMIPPKLTRNYLDGVRITNEKAAALKEKIREMFARYFVAGQTEEYISSRFDALLEQNNRWGEILTQAQKNYNPQIPSAVQRDEEK